MTHITPQQKEIMLDFIKARPKLCTGKFSPDFTLAQSRALWQELTQILNAHPNGAKKEWSGWRKTWIDIKKNSKAKLAKEKKHQKGTGGGPPEPATIDSFENKVMELTSPVCVTGNMEVPEPSVILDDEVLFGEVFPSNRQEETEKHDHAYISSVTPPPNENEDRFAGLKRNETENTRKIHSPKIQNHPRSKPRITKTMRLNESIKNHTKLVNISERAIKETNAYRLEKLQVMKEEQEELKKQTRIMENISAHLGGIVDIMKEIV